jgi:predicted DNA-binding protein
MSHTITIRLKPEQAEWLAATAKRTGVPQGKIIRDQLEKAMAAEQQGFLRLAGAVAGPRDLSTRRGFSRS